MSVPSIKKIPEIHHSDDMTAMSWLEFDRLTAVDEDSSFNAFHLRDACIEYNFTSVSPLVFCPRSSVVPYSLLFVEN